MYVHKHAFTCLQGAELWRSSMYWQCCLFSSLVPDTGSRQTLSHRHTRTGSWIASLGNAWSNVCHHVPPSWRGLTPSAECTLLWSYRHVVSLRQSSVVSLNHMLRWKQPNRSRAASRFVVFGAPPPMSSCHWHDVHSFSVAPRVPRTVRKCSV